jgi:hypothetical protein
MTILICLLIITLVTVGILSLVEEDRQLEQEYAPIPVKVEEKRILPRNHYRR